MSFTGLLSSIRTNCPGARKTSLLSLKAGEIANLRTMYNQFPFSNVGE